MSKERPEGGSEIKHIDFLVEKNLKKGKSNCKDPEVTRSLPGIFEELQKKSVSLKQRET